MRFARLTTLISTALAVFCLGEQAQAVACGFDCEATIDKQNAGDEFTLPDGTTFYGIDPSDPSTGTGVFEPFVRGQRTGSDKDNLPEGQERYYNTDGAIEFDTKQGQTGGTNWTHSVEFSTIQSTCGGEACV